MDLIYFIKLSGLSLPDYYHPTSRHTRHHYSLHLIIPPSNTTAHTSSFSQTPSGIGTNYRVHY